MSYENASLPLQSTTKPDLNKNPSNLMADNDIEISVDSESRSQADHLPLTLRVENPDIFSDVIELFPANKHYEPALRSIMPSPEIHHITPIFLLPQELVVVPPSNSWQGNAANYGQPAIIRKVSKTLVEQQELLPPLEVLPPLLIDSHLLSSTTASSNHSVSSTAEGNNNNHSSVPSSPSPPRLPQHQFVFSPSSPTPKSPDSVAQQSINAMAEQPTTSPDEIEHNDLIKLTEQTSMNQHHQPGDHRRQSQTVLREQSPPNPRPPLFQHDRIPLVAPSPTPSSIHTAKHMHQQQHQQHASYKYCKASHSLTNQPGAIKLYRSMAAKTKDVQVQLDYAKFLLEMASLYDAQHCSYRPNLSLELPLLRPASVNSRCSSIDTHITHNTIDPDSVLAQNNLVDANEEAANCKKRKMLEEEGVRWINKLAHEGEGEAAYLWALWHDRGMYNRRTSIGKALKYYRIAANKKVPEAIFAMGQYHERGKDYIASFKCYGEAAGLGLVEAFYRIAMIYLNGEFGFPRNINSAISLLTKASEESTGTCPDAPYTLGLLLTNDHPSINLPSELIQKHGGTFAGITYLSLAANMGKSDAQYRLGYINENGFFGHPINIVKAFEYYQLAAKNNNAYAMLGLSRIYNQGIKVPSEQLEEQQIKFIQDESKWTTNNPRNEDEAFKWCHSAADQKLATAFYLLGWYYETGIGVPRDLAQARHYYSKAVKGNHDKAQDRINQLEPPVKDQKSEKRRRMAQNKRISVLTANTNNSSNRDTKCQIM